ncbi:MAG: PadR family transcriptional regulator [Anaerolineales bacterium]|jgi:PadR family transcriptional regulator PadR
MINKTYSQEIEKHLPLREATFFILLSLAPGKRHGYAILKDVEELSEKRVLLSTGTLYGALKRLLDLGWIERVDEVPVNGENNRSGPPRKVYSLTLKGRQVLEAEAGRLEGLLTSLRMRLSEREG